MSQFTSIEVLGLKQLLDRYAQISELVDRLPQILDLVDPMRPLQPEPPQPVATLCEAAEALMLFVDQHCNYHDLDPLLADVRHALTAERKRADLVKEAFREYKAGHVTNCACRACEALRALDAFDKGAENG